MLLICLLLFTLTYAHEPIVLEEGSLDQQTLGKDGLLLLYKEYPDEWTSIMEYAEDIEDLYFFEVNCNNFHEFCLTHTKTFPTILYSVENSIWEKVEDDLQQFTFDTFERRCVYNREKCNEDQLNTLEEFEQESPETINNAIDDLRGRIVEFEATFEDYYQKLQDEFNKKRIDIRDSILKTEEIINLLNDLL